MKKYKAVIFDLDNTLLNFDAAEEVALQMTFSSRGRELSEMELELYRQINDKQWGRMQKKLQSKEETVVKRFEEFAEKINLTGHDAAEINAQFLRHVTEPVEFEPHALHVLQTLTQRGYKLALLSNGIKSVQHVRLERSGLHQFFPVFVTSEETGWLKPDPRIFHETCARAKVKPSEAIYVGDSYEADVLGARAAHMDVIWYQKKEATAPPDDRSVPVIDDLRQLLSIL
ncbi:MAG TPA: YjjG family noncanonical pyrimidine nucleotidase [Thermotogota bacterium]|nr:YjjG family noncanonical pyrimidine nucleotidase [Thermotogota bacterium]HRW91969.1 YjjG family noncanonical pyrimidine nucleotidase [Thermotogota bacterium]